MPRFLLLLVVLLSGCASLEVEPAPPYLAVRGMRIVGPCAVHCYVLWKGEEHSFPRKTHLHKRVRHERLSSWDPEDESYTVLRGPEALAAIARLKTAVESYPRRPEYGSDPYLAWPGPNSNAFVADLCRRAEIAAELPATAVGQDWPALIPWVLDVRPTTTRTGLQVDLFSVLGVQLGLREGVELHFLGSKFGVDLWPPAFKLPLAGRLGFPEALSLERTDDLGAWAEEHRDAPDPKVRIQAAQAAAKATPPSDALLFELLADAEPKVRAAALDGLTNAYRLWSFELEWTQEVCAQVTEAGCELARSDSPELRARALEALLYFKLRDAFSHLRSPGELRLREVLGGGLEDEDKRVRQAAAKAILRLATVLDLDETLSARAELVAKARR